MRMMLQERGRLIQPRLPTRTAARKNTMPANIPNQKNSQKTSNSYGKLRVRDWYQKRGLTGAEVASIG